MQNKQPRRISNNGMHSPRVLPNHQRLYSNYSPQAREYLSPHNTSYPLQQATCINSPRGERMAISKGKDGRYYRQKVEGTKGNDEDKNRTASKFYRINTLESTAMTAINSPMKRSHFPCLE